MAASSVTTSTSPSGRRLTSDSSAERYVRRKRPPVLQSKPNEIYVNRSSNFPSLLERCKKLLCKESEIVIHGLGAVINRAINLALALEQDGHGTLVVSVNTGTVQLVDDLTPLDDKTRPRSEVRSNSTVCIRVYKASLQELQDSSVKASPSKRRCTDDVQVTSGMAGTTTSDLAVALAAEAEKISKKVTSSARGARRRSQQSRGDG